MKARIIKEKPVVGKNLLINVSGRYIEAEVRRIYGNNIFLIHKSRTGRRMAIKRNINELYEWVKK